MQANNEQSIIKVYRQGDIWLYAEVKVKGGCLYKNTMCDRLYVLLMKKHYDDVGQPGYTSCLRR